MGEQTTLDKVKYFFKWKEMLLMNLLLKRNGYDFGIYWAEELEKMYQENKHKIKLD